MAIMEPFTLLIKDSLEIIVNLKVYISHLLCFNKIFQFLVSGKSSSL